MLLPEPVHTGNWLLDKATLMNQTLAGPERLVPRPMALGGNMVFHRDLFAHVGFDPGITRGEDIDYLINARLTGRQFYLDRLLRITHLPPRHYESPPYGKMRQDVLRFVYEREKIRLGALTPEVFDPYPGRLLRDDLDEHAREALAAIATPEMVARLGPPDDFLTEARRRAQELAPRYFAFAARWPRMVEALAHDERLRERLAQLAGWRARKRGVPRTTIATLPSPSAQPRQARGGSRGAHTTSASPGCRQLSRPPGGAASRPG